MLILFLPILSCIGAVTLNGSTEYAIPGEDYNLTCYVPEEATKVSFYRRPLMTESPQHVEVAGTECYILVASKPVLCTPDVCSCQPSMLQYATIFRLVLQPRPGDHNSLWFCRRQNSNLTNEFEDSPDFSLQVFEEVTSIALQNPPPTLQEYQVITLVCVTSPCRPPASVLWSVGGNNYTSRSTSTIQSTLFSFLTIGRLTINATRDMDGQTVLCSAYNRHTVVTSTIQPTLDVQYGPGTTISLSLIGSNFTIDEGDTLPDITCTADCRPGCTFVWTKPDKTNFTTSPVLSLGQMNRNEHGTFSCTAYNIIGSSIKTFNLLVRYPPSTPKIVKLSTNRFLGGGEYRVLSCQYSEGFPSPANVEWFVNSVPTTLSTSTIILGPLRQESNGLSYTCRVHNEFTDVRKINLTSTTCNLIVTRRLQIDMAFVFDFAALSAFR